MKQVRYRGHTYNVVLKVTYNSLLLLEIPENSPYYPIAWYGEDYIGGREYGVKHLLQAGKKFLWIARGAAEDYYDDEVPIFKDAVKKAIKEGCII